MLQYSTVSLWCDALHWPWLFGTLTLASSARIALLVALVIHFRHGKHRRRPWVFLLSMPRNYFFDCLSNQTIFSNLVPIFLIKLLMNVFWREWLYLDVGYN